MENEIHSHSIFIALFLFLAVSIAGTARAQESDSIRTVVQTGHLADVKDYDISADGHFAATLDKNGQVILWNLKTNHQYREFIEPRVQHVYFNSRSTAIVLECANNTVAYDIATGKRIGYWKNRIPIPDGFGDSKPNPYVEAIIVKQCPKHLKGEAIVSTLHINDAVTGRLVTVLDGKVDAIHYVATYMMGQSTLQKTSDGKADACWWVGTSTPQRWDLSQGKMVGQIDFEGNAMCDTLWRDALGDLVFWDRQGTLRRYRFSDGKFMDAINLAGAGRLHGLCFLSDNQTVVYDRKNQIWQTNLKKQKSHSLPFINFHTKTWDTETKSLDKPTQYKTVDVVRKITPDMRDSYVVAFGALARPDSFFVLLNGIYGPLMMKLGSSETKIGANAGESVKKLVQMGNGHDLLITPSNVCPFIDRRARVRYSESSSISLSSASIFDAKRLAIGDRNGRLSIYDMSIGQVTDQLHPHTSTITDIATHPDLPLALTASTDGTVGIVDTKNKQMLAYLISCNDGRDYIVRTPDNYYMSSPNGTDAIHFAVSTDTYQFDQFDLKYNRPDIVLQRIGLADEKQIQMLHHAYEKRLRRMNFTEEMLSNDFHVPTLTISNANQLSQASTPQQTLRIAASDTKYRLNRINVWINGVPVLGRNGKAVRPERNVNVDIPLTLADGHNLVEVSCLNEKGAESYRQAVEVNLPPAQSKPDLWMVLMGISKHADQRFDLNYAAKDAHDVATALHAVNSEDYHEIHTLLLTDQDVNLDQLPRIHDFLKNARRNDAAILFYAGHGLVDSSLDYYLSTYDTDFSVPSQRAIPYDSVEQLLDGIAPLRKLLLLDACHSGEIDKEDVVMTNNQRRKSVNGDIAFRSAGQGVPQITNVGAAQLNAVLSENFSNLKRGTGATVISSASGLQIAIEGSQWQNGLFSYCLMQGLRDRQCDTDGDGHISVSELQQYCQQQVALLSEGRQQPTSRTENRHSDFHISSFLTHQ